MLTMKKILHTYGRPICRFKHIMPREINGCSAKTAMIIQGIRAIGKGKMTQEQAERFSSALSEDDKETLLKDAKSAAAWIYKDIKRICEGNRQKSTAERRLAPQN